MQEVRQLACLMRSVSGGWLQKCKRRTARRAASRQPRATRCAAAKSSWLKDSMAKSSRGSLSEPHRQCGLEEAQQQGAGGAAVTAGGGAARQLLPPAAGCIWMISIRLAMSL